MSKGANALLAWSILLLPLPLATQASGRAAGPKIVQIRVTGNHRFSAAKIVAASGLRVGDAATERRLDEAASRLSSSGAFTDITYQYRARTAGWEAIFKVVEAEKFYPCTFDNFLFFTDAELLSALAHEAPLFDGSLPEGQGMQKQVTAALDKFLGTKQAPGSTTVRTILGLDGKLAGFAIRITGVSMPVKEVQVTGGPLEASTMSEAGHGIVDHDYSRSAARALAEIGLTAAYQDKGYWQVKFSEPAPVLRDPAGKDPSQGIIVTYRVTLGLRYRWAGVTWSGTQSMTADQLNKRVLIPDGEIARRKPALDGWDAVRRALGHFGYLQADVTPKPQFDDTAATVHFDAQIKEGPQFTMGDLRVEDPSSKVVEIMTAAWPLARGQIYDAEAEKRFLEKDAAHAQQRAGRKDKHLIFSRALSPGTRSVSVLLKFQ